MEKSDPLLRYVKEIASIFGAIAVSIIVFTILAVVLSLCGII